MKNMFLFIIILCVLSCSNFYDNNWYQINEIPADLQNIAINEKGICTWVITHIHYKMYVNGFHSAQKTLDEKEGNCANRALLKLALIYKLYGGKGDLYYGWMKINQKRSKRDCIIKPHLMI
jgi:hypothetical protein